MMEMRWRGTVARTPVATCAALALAVSLSSAAPAGAAAAPVARAAGRCVIGSKEGRALGPTYVTQLSVSHTSCTTGTSVIKAYNRCRLASGGVKGRCHSRVLGFSCTEQRPQTGPIQFIGKVHCTSGRAVVNFTYVEFT